MPQSFMTKERGGWERGGGRDRAALRQTCRAGGGAVAGLRLCGAETPARLCAGVGHRGGGGLADL